jgi:low temperature requirement protein LtrA
MSFWKRPAIRQYFHQGLIWRAEEKEEVAAFELFVDLLYVGIIAINGDRLAEDPTGMALLQFIITFVLSWKLWSELTQIVSWFETDDIFQRLCVLFFMACLTGFTLNIENAFGSTYTALIGFYLAQRFFQAIYFLWLAYLLPIIRGVMVGSVILILISATIWIGSIHVDGTQRLALIWVALPLELYGSSIFFSFIRNESEMGFLIWVKSHLQFYPGILSRSATWKGLLTKRSC